MPDEISFLGLTGTSDLIHEYFLVQLLFVCEYSSIVIIMFKLICFSLFHKDRGK